MRARTAALPLLAALAVGGCLPSAQPIYTEQTLVAEPALVGTWGDDKSGTTWVFSTAGEKQYRLVFTDKQGQSGQFTARVALLQGTRVLDLFPDKAQVAASEFYKFHLVPVHTVFLIKQVEPTLTLAGLNLGWLDQRLKLQPDAIEHLRLEKQPPIITAPTRQLQAFVLEHKDQAFTVELKLRRR